MGGALKNYVHRKQNVLGGVAARALAYGGNSHTLACPDYRYHYHGEKGRKQGDPRDCLKESVCRYG